MLICPSCRKKFKSRVIVCLDCQIELLPPTMIDLRDRHPDLAVSLSDQIVVMDAYVKLLECSLNEFKEIAGLLETEGVVCVAERNQSFRYDYNIEGGSQIDDQKSLVVKVRADQLSKAKALLTWEVDRAVDENNERVLNLCPSCNAEVSALEKACPECSNPLFDQNTEDLEVERYRCSACGAPASLEDPTCENCGARLDH